MAINQRLIEQMQTLEAWEVVNYGMVRFKDFGEGFLWSRKAYPCESSENQYTNGHAHTMSQFLPHKVSKFLSVRLSKNS